MMNAVYSDVNHSDSGQLCELTLLMSKFKLLNYFVARCDEMFNVSGTH